MIIIITAGRYIDSEKELRDFISDAPQLLMPGLETVDVEHRVYDDNQGWRRRGFGQVDILTKTSDKWFLIECKYTNFIYHVFRFMWGGMLQLTYYRHIFSREEEVDIKDVDGILLIYVRDRDEDDVLAIKEFEEIDNDLIDPLYDRILMILRDVFEERSFRHY